METRPQSIVNFERFYLGAFLLGLINTLLSWRATQATLDASPTAEMFGNWFLPLTILFSVAVTLLLWFFIARQGSAVAKWIATIFVAFGLISLLFTLSAGTFPSGIGGILAIIATILQLIAVTFLFRADTRPWFGEASL